MKFIMAVSFVAFKLTLSGRCVIFREPLITWHVSLCERQV